MDRLLYGAAYYPEYEAFSGMKENLDERIDKDFSMMKKAGMNVVRIAESTWSTWEQQDGVFDFSILVKTLEYCERAGMQVIIGTPTYAVPAWLVKKDPSVLAETYYGTPGFGEEPKAIYGRRQIMDITNPTYLFYAERIIRKLCEVTKKYDCVIGYQLDNETKYYGAAGEGIRRKFKEYLKAKFGTVQKMNEEFGLAYWSNSIGDWDDLPDVRGTINASFGCEFDRFRRSLAADFLKWQRGIVDEYRRKEPWTDASGRVHDAQFITHNTDFDWRISLDGEETIPHSYGPQNGINHYEASGALTMMGTDIYHPSQDLLTGRETAYGGDSCRTIQRAVAARGDAPVTSQYMVLETEAQAFKEWTPYPGQLRLQALSHLASGSLGVEYWHWHSIHNSFETYWKGVLSHDMESNAVYEETKEIGVEFEKLSPYLIGFCKQNRTALVVDSLSQTAQKWFPIDGRVSYDDVVMQYHRALYDQNIECDVIDIRQLLDEEENTGSEETGHSADYRVLVVPALYCASDKTIKYLRSFVENGGTLIAGFRSFYADECVKMRCGRLPYGMTDVFGCYFQEISVPGRTKLVGKPVRSYMELLIPDGCRVLASYEHPYWNRYAGITMNHFGKGTAVYIGGFCDLTVLKDVMRDAVSAAYSAETSGRGTSSAESPEGMKGAGEGALPESGIIGRLGFPVIVRSGHTADGRAMHFIFNYSEDAQTIENPYRRVEDLLTAKTYESGESIALSDWGAAVLIER